MEGIFLEALCSRLFIIEAAVGCSNGVQRTPEGRVRKGLYLGRFVVTPLVGSTPTPRDSRTRNWGETFL